MGAQSAIAMVNHSLGLSFSHDLIPIDGPVVPVGGDIITTAIIWAAP